MRTTQSVGDSAVTSWDVFKAPIEHGLATPNPCSMGACHRSKDHQMTLNKAAFVFLALLGLSARASLGQDIDDQQLLRMIDALQSPLKSLYCEYEGERLEYQLAVGNDMGLYQRFSGIFRYKAKDKYLNDIYHDFLANKLNPQRRIATQSILSTGSGTQIFSRADGSSGRVEARHVTSVDFEITGSYGRIFLVRTLREDLKYDKKRLVVEGTEVVDGTPCERYAIVMGKQPYSIDTGLVVRYWVDLARNGHVLKKERWSRGQLLNVVSEIELKSYQGESGKVWIPVKGKSTNMYNGSKSSDEYYRVLQGSVRVGGDIPDRQFSVKYPVGTPISDHLKGVFYEFGQDRRPPPVTSSDAQARLDENLAKAAENRAELVAASWSRGGWINWAFWGPLFASLVGAFFALVLYVIRLKRAP